MIILFYTSWHWAGGVKLCDPSRFDGARYICSYWTTLFLFGEQKQPFKTQVKTQQEVGVNSHEWFCKRCYFKNIRVALRI